MDAINPETPDVLDYATFVTVLIGIICNILIIDTFVHKSSLRTGLRLALMTWSICDLFYLFNTPGFVHLLLKPFGVQTPAARGEYALEPHITEEPASMLLLQFNCVILMWFIMFTPIEIEIDAEQRQEATSKCHTFLRFAFVMFFIVMGFAVSFARVEMSLQQCSILRHIMILLLIVLIFVNEFQYLRLMCDDDLDTEYVHTSLIKINVIRIYAYNWCVMYFLRYAAAYGLHDAIGKHIAARCFYLFTISLTLTVFLTALYELMYLLCNDRMFRQHFIFHCNPCRWRTNNMDENYVLLGGRFYGTPLYYTAEVY